MSKIKDSMTTADHIRFEEAIIQQNKKPIRAYRPYPIYSQEEVMQHNETVFINRTNPFDR